MTFTFRIFSNKKEMWMNLETKFLDPNPQQSVRLFFVPSSIRIQSLPLT